MMFQGSQNVGDVEQDEIMDKLAFMNDWEQREIINTISKEEIDELAIKHLNPEEMVILVVGDAKTYRPKLEALGYDVLDVSEKGDIIEPVKEDVSGTEGK